MYSPITQMQTRVFDELRRFEASHGYMPTVRELAARTGRAISTLHQHLRALEAKGRLASTGSPRGIVILDQIGNPGALAPALVGGEVRDHKVLLLPSHRRRRLKLPFGLTKRGTLLLHVTDHSLRDKSIQKDDYLLYNSHQSRKPGQTQDEEIDLQGRALALIRPL